MKVSSGITAKATSGDGYIEILAAQTEALHTVRVCKASGAAAFISLDGGASYDYWPSASVAYDYDSITVPPGTSIILRRVPSGSDVTGVFCSAWT